MTGSGAATTARPVGEGPVQDPWWRVRLDDALPSPVPLLLVLVGLTALQSSLRVVVSPPGTYRDLGVVVGAVVLLVAVEAGLVALHHRRAGASPAVAVAAVAALLVVDLVVVGATSHRAVYGEGLFVATGVGLGCLCLLAVRPLGAVAAAGGLHALVMVGGSLVHEPGAPALALARGTEVAAAGLVPVVAGATYLLLVARLAAERRASDRDASREEAERRAASAAGREAAERLAVVRTEVGPLLERVVAGAPVPLEPDDAALAAASSRRLRSRLLRVDARTWLDDALDAAEGVRDGRHPEPASGGGPEVVVRAGDDGQDVDEDLRGPLVALVRRARALGGEVSVVLLGGGAVVAVRGARSLAHDGVAVDLLARLGAAGWIAEGEDLLVLEVGAADGVELP
ncbi:hypothetical protein [uncultured Pseudokineococcus sp.]|uniref:hypothetical protein n=1 Tax=uncultured Pseudokineococcus sp. TaxID=1642928 RepID=UPI00260E5D72|nr:hypothetical protein [uncultured Pseudokineococcus sp.]